MSLRFLVSFSWWLVVLSTFLCTLLLFFLVLFSTIVLTGIWPWMSRFFGRKNHRLFVSIIACQLSYSVGSSWVFSNMCGWRIFSQIWKPWRKAVLPFLSAVTTSSSVPFHCSPGFSSAVSLNFWLELDADLPPVNKSAKVYQHDKIITVLAVIVKNSFYWVFTICQALY